MTKSNPAKFKFTSTFRWGSELRSITDFIPTYVLDKLRRKYSDDSEDTLAISLRELLKYLYLCAHSPNPIFFPGNQMIDDVWHNLITETIFYKDLCNKIKYGTFVNHSGITYSDYLNTHGAVELGNEHFTWVASYLNSFGPIDEAAFAMLPIARDFAEYLKLDLDGLNALASSLSKISTAKSFQLEDFIHELVEPQAHLIDRDPVLMGNITNELVRGVRHTRNKFTLDNSELEKIYGVSPAFAFTVWQHLAATERIAQSQRWQENNPELWAEISLGQQLCGLATTHIAKSGPPMVTGTAVNNGFLINGCAPWSSGFKIFDLLVLGFLSSNQIIFCTVEFPKTEATECISIHRKELGSLNGTSSVSITYKDFFIRSDAIISTRMTNERPKSLASKYILPDLGIGKRALSLTWQILKSTSSVKHDLAAEAARRLDANLKTIEIERSKLFENNESEDAHLVFETDKFNRDSVQLLSIATGSRGLTSGSAVLLLHSNLLLYDSVIQPQKTIKMKLEHLGHKSDE